MKHTLEKFEPRMTLKILFAHLGLYSFNEKLIRVVRYGVIDFNSLLLDRLE